tara:strand:+ start:429 stop:836 length:408 start_codon:yes stop_codon:yes gene_type:complete
VNNLGLKIHHIGIVVKDIGAYLKSSQHNKKTDIIYDPIQHSHICLIDDGLKTPLIELIEPIDEKSTTFQYLKKNGTSMHHFCYEIDNYNRLEAYMKQNNLKRIFGPVEAVIFNGKKVVFCFSIFLGIMEFLLLED